jgi:hypothetical protein
MSSLDLKCTIYFPDDELEKAMSLEEAVEAHIQNNDK